jgi:hypothetical protein
MRLEIVNLADIEASPAPRCPECGEAMHRYGGTVGWIHCGYKLLYRQGGWFKNGMHIRDDRLAGGNRSAEGVRERS